MNLYNVFVIWLYMTFGIIVTFTSPSLGEVILYPSIGLVLIWYAIWVERRDLNQTGSEDE